MQVSCPSCSTAYEIPPPVRPRRLRCARCETEWRALPPEAPSPEEQQETSAPVVVVAVASEPLPPEQRPTEPRPIEPVPQAAVMPSALIGDALGAPLPARRTGAGTVWLLAWVASVAVIGAVLFAGWHGRGSLEHAWPQCLWLFRLLPGGVPV